MKYTVEIHGKGADCIIHKITPNQESKLLNGNVESDALSYDEICDILEVGDLFEDAEYVKGLYVDSDDYEMIVRNQHEHQVWSSSDIISDFPDYEEEFLYDNGYFIVEDHQMGQFFEFQISDIEFDPEKLNIIISCLAEDRVELVTGITYDGEKIENIGSDTKSRGFIYHVV